MASAAQNPAPAEGGAATRTAATYQGRPHARPSSRARAVDAAATGTATEPPCQRSPGGPLSGPSRLPYLRYTAAGHLDCAGQETSLTPYPRRRRRLTGADAAGDRKSTRLNSSHSQISYAVFCLKKKKKQKKRINMSVYRITKVYVD